MYYSCVSLELRVNNINGIVSINAKPNLKKYCPIAMLINNGNGNFIPNPKAIKINTTVSINCEVIVDKLFQIQRFELLPSFLIKYSRTV